MSGKFKLDLRNGRQKEAESETYEHWRGDKSDRSRNHENFLYNPGKPAQERQPRAEQEKRP